MSGQRCGAAHPEDPTTCMGPGAAVTITDRTGSSVTGCVHHGARLLASIRDGSVSSRPGHDGAASDAYEQSQGLKPFPWRT